MAGSYADPYGKRLAWDRDGTGAIYHNGTVAVDLTLSRKQGLNGEDGFAGAGDPTNLFSAGTYYALVFAEMTTVTHLFWKTAVSQTGTFQWYYSLDTTTGVDGTWTSFRGPVAIAPGNIALSWRDPVDTGYYASSPFPLSVRGLKWRLNSITGNTRAGAMHVYGYKTATAANRLELWHPTLDQKLADTPVISDHGDVARGFGYKSFSFRVKNVSATLTAQTVTVSREALTNGSPTIVSLTDLRYDGGTYGATAAVGNLAPGAISNIVDCRTQITAGAPVGNWAARCIAAAASWV